MKILVTGASGFVGKHVVQALKDEHVLLTPGRHELNLLNKSGPGYHCEIQQYGYQVGFLVWYLLENNIDTIIHLAGNVGGIGYNKNNQGKLGFENLQMGLNILEAARLAKIKKLIIVGTTCSYPCTPKTIPFIESELFDGMPELTNSGYGVAKRTLVKLAMEYASQYGMNITNLIPANMYGPFDHFGGEGTHVIPAIINKFENPDYDPGLKCCCPCHGNTHAIRHCIPCCLDGSYKIKPSNTIRLWGTGNASREFLYIEDFVRSIVLALETNTGPEPINIGTGQEITIRDLAYLIKKIGYYHADIMWDDSKPDGQPRRSLNIDRAKNILGWEPLMPLQNGLANTIKYYRNSK